MNETELQPLNSITYLLRNEGMRKSILNSLFILDLDLILNSLFILLLSPLRYSCLIAALLSGRVASLLNSDIQSFLLELFSSPYLF